MFFLSKTEVETKAGIFISLVIIKLFCKGDQSLNSFAYFHRPSSKVDAILLFIWRNKCWNIWRTHLLLIWRVEGVFDGLLVVVLPPVRPLFCFDQITRLWFNSSSVLVWPNHPPFFFVFLPIDLLDLVLHCPCWSFTLTKWQCLCLSFDQMTLLLPIDLIHLVLHCPCCFGLWPNDPPSPPGPINPLPRTTFLRPIPRVLIHTHAQSPIPRCVGHICNILLNHVFGGQIFVIVVQGGSSWQPFGDRRKSHKPLESAHLQNFATKMPYL